MLRAANARNTAWRLAWPDTEPPPRGSGVREHLEATALGMRVQLLRGRQPCLEPRTELFQFALLFGREWNR